MDFSEETLIFCMMILTSWILYRTPLPKHTERDFCRDSLLWSVVWCILRNRCCEIHQSFLRLALFYFDYESREGRCSFAVMVFIADE